MAKITYLLGAGASYNACPILEKQAEMMIAIARKEIFPLIRTEPYGDSPHYDFLNKSYLEINDKNEFKILWWMGYFGEKAKEYNTIDTYARKLFLNNEKGEYRLLKMCVSVFFDLWENYYSCPNALNDVTYSKIDNRYKSLFSILLNEVNGNIKLNNDFKFITWNYDLQLEETYKMFLGQKYFQDYDSINDNFKFKELQYEEETNDVFHLNGHRGYFKDATTRHNEQELILNISPSIEGFWKNINWLYESTLKGSAKFDSYIKYAWEHNLNDPFFNRIEKVIRETDVLVIIGYSFPAFNRQIDHFLFNTLQPNKIRKIIYQDPNANRELILNLFKNPHHFEHKIEILNDEKSMKQFYLPNEYFISQEDNSGKYSM